MAIPAASALPSTTPAPTAAGAPYARSGTHTADVVVIGGGVIGASIAAHLAGRGRSVIVLDAGTPGGGSTGRATGGYRAQFATRVNVQLSLLAREKLLGFAEETGIDAGYQPVGYLFCARDEPSLAALMRAQAVQHAAGLVASRRVSVSDIAALNPALATRDLVGGVFCPTDGYIRPLQLLAGYRMLASRLGVDFLDRTPVTALEQDASGRIVAVRTATMRIACDAVVNAAGPWAAPVAAMAGVALPVVPVRRHVAVTVRTRALPPDMPMTILTEDGFHFRVRDERVLLLWPGPADAPGAHRADDRPVDDRAVDEAWLPEVARRADVRVPVLRGVPIDRAACWSGLYEQSPDDHLLFGAAPGVPNFLLANGSSGHGVMHAPAIGQLMAELLCDGVARTVDMHALRPSRFADGAAIPGAVLL